MVLTYRHIRYITAFVGNADTDITWVDDNEATTVAARAFSLVYICIGMGLW